MARRGCDIKLPCDPNHGTAAASPVRWRKPARPDDVIGNDTRRWTEVTTNVQPADKKPAAQSMRAAAWAIQVENSIRKWLPAHCLTLPGVSRAIAVVGDPEKKEFRVVATWPQGFAGSDDMLEMAPIGFEGRSEARRLRSETGRKIDRIAMPIFHKEKFLGALVVEADGLKNQQRKDLYATINGKPPKRTSDAEATANRLEIVLDVLATCLNAEPANIALHAMVSELASRTGCDRISLGQLHWGRINVIAISANDRLEETEEFVEALSAAMLAATRRRENIIYPCRSNSIPDDRPHALLSRYLGGARVMTVPLTLRGELYGALTLERHGNTTFGPGIAELCTALEQLAGPVIDLKLRKEQQPIGRRLLTRLVQRKTD